MAATAVPLTAVEASSLSAAVTQVASNPPQNPFEQPHNAGPPLTLYIARVPGSRDVFLTPHKPREKVVTAQDVQSSLYFVHFHDHQDRRLSGGTQQQRPSSAPEPRSAPPLPARSGLQRKPAGPRLPKRPAAGPLTPPHSSDDGAAEYQEFTQNPFALSQVTRKPVIKRGTNQQAPAVAIIPPPLPRRPLPTPPAELDAEDSHYASRQRLLRKAEHTDASANPYLRQYGAEDNHSPVFSEVDESPALIEAISTASSTFEPGTLTLIRRDPASGQQWNVASIADPPVQEVSSAATLDPRTAGRRVKKGSAPLYLDITNPGYSVFAETPRPSSRKSTSVESSEPDEMPEGVLRRRLYMPGSKFGEHSYGHNSYSSGQSINDGDGMRKSMRQRGSFDFSAPEVDRRSKGYAFTSPWNGHCEFSTASSGRSLKCRHSIPGNGTTEVVSELRFNLPKASHNLTPAAKHKHIRHRSESSSLADDVYDTQSMQWNEDGSLNLDLGREKAGGGSGGKQAKLGKLIVEPEGLKMLDLLVAANLGLWWRAWERV